MTEKFCPVSIRKEGTKKIPVKINTSEAEKGPEDKLYILLYFFSDRDEEEVSFSVQKGRTNMYNKVKELAENLDLFDSKVLLEGEPFDIAISVYEFMIYMEDKFEEDGFDIRDFVIGDPPEYHELRQLSIYDIVNR